MNRKNVIYPCGNDKERYLVYKVNCPSCDKVIHLMLADDSYSPCAVLDMNTCHPFIKSIERGSTDFYPHKMIKIREDISGGKQVSYDNYHLYPIIENETEDDRKQRLIDLKLSELSDLLTDDIEKKKWIISTLVNKNESITNVLEPLLNKYVTTDKDQWKTLDKVVMSIKKKDDANSLLERLSAKIMGPTLEPSKETKKEIILENDEWICPVCNSVTNKKYCPNCGSPKSNQ